MNFRYARRSAVTLTAIAALAGCQPESALRVDNLDAPDVGRAFSTADGIEAVLRNGVSQALNAILGTTTAITPAAHVMAFESYGSVANFGMNLRATIPRAPIDNNRGNATQAENLRDFQQQSLRGRTIANAIRALDAFVAGGGSLGSEAANLRARSFGFFALAMMNGNMALMYDSVGVSTPALESADVPPLTGYAESMTIALQQLDSAIAIATAANAASSSIFPLPTTWIRNRAGATSFADYIRLMRTFKAKFRAGVARTPAERAAVNWNEVVADAAAGITSDFELDMNANEGWSLSWISQAMVFVGWHNMTPYIIGMADTTSGYASWIATPRGNRASFLIQTPDKRFPAGDSRAAQLANSPASNAQLPSVYFRNRPPGEDSPGEAWGASPYDFVRFRAYRTGSSIGPWVWISQTENDMLRAEGLIRLNRAAEAVPLINRTRERNGLPPFPAGATATTRAPAHPGGSATSCVPRTPTGPNNSLECGTLMEAMKWEKRMETAFTGYAQWFIDSRGWGDLPVGTATQWPVPYQEMDARRQPFYNSLTGPEWLAPSSTYGFGTGSN